MFRLLTLLALLAITASAHADTRTITFYSDGAVVEVESTASKGLIEVPLPPGMVRDSLRVKPIERTSIVQVEQISNRQEGKGAKELDQLLEQKSRLEDRLQALNTREDIFKAAAKSQSGKAPRKTKNNPDPMQTIRQGTDFAIAQLEAVNTARRKAEAEMRRIESKIQVLKRAGQGLERVARMVVNPKNGRVRLRYTVEGVAWTPRYDMRLSQGQAAITLFGQVPGWYDGYRVQARPGRLGQETSGQAVATVSGVLVPLADYLLPVNEASFSDGAYPVFSFAVTNTGRDHLPGGEAALYRNGEYWGRFRFEGLSSGRNRQISSAR